MITPKRLRKTANKLREIVDLMEELGGTPGWPLLIGFDLDFLAEEFDKHAKRLEQSHREPPSAGYRAGGPNG